MVEKTRFVSSEQQLDFPGIKYPLSEELQVLYPEGVWCKENGCPHLTPYARERVQLEVLMGNRNQDEIRANRAVGISETPDGMTWHHVEDGITMELVPENLHRAIKHTGGVAKIKEERRK